jgi:hypothetical protein
MAFSTAALTAYVKRKYDPKFIENSMTSVEDSILRAIKKETDGSGEQYSWLVDADDAFNGGLLLATAQAASAANDIVVGSKFLSNWNDSAAVAQISSSIIGKTKNNDGAWMKAVDVAMRKTMKAYAHLNALFIQSYGWGDVGQITSPSGSTFVPLVRSDITKYIKGMPLVFGADLHTSAVRSTTPLYVTAVNYTQGSELVTVSGALSGPGALANDWVFVADLRSPGSSPSMVAIAGLKSILPNQVASADLPDTTISQLFGPDRSSNSRLYGTFIDASGGGSLVEALIDGAQEAITVGNAKKLRLFASKAVYAGVAKDLQNAVRYNDNDGNKTVGTKRLMVYADGDAEATLEVSRTTNDNQVWGFDPSQLILRSIGGAPHIDMEDGLTMARQSTVSGYEVRYFQQALLEFTNTPGMLRIQLTSQTGNA